MYRLGLLLTLFFHCLVLQGQGTKPSKLEIHPEAVNFIVMGDWGRNGTRRQKQVAIEMGKTAAAVHADFIITTGDNFYPAGVRDEFDPQWRSSYEDVYTDSALHVNWYPVLGNHDYALNAEAQVAYSRISHRWKMPARYYAQMFRLKDDTTSQILFAFLDTNPLVPRYHLRGFPFQGQDTTAQKIWLNDLLARAPSTVRWKIAVGHHPMYTGGTRQNEYDTRAVRGSLQPVFEKYKVDVYLSGHEHTLQHIGPVKSIHHFISGTASDRRGVRKLSMSRFASSKFGFMLFTVTKKMILVQVISRKGKILYKTWLIKN